MITLKTPFTSQTEIKKSRFIAHAAPVQSKEAAMAFLAAVRDDTATHNCWAYKIGNEYRFSDDGEPGGTAGKPILAAIDGSGVDGVMVVVVRFFGGIKLGAGGLVRAYGNAAATCIGHAEKEEVIPMVALAFQIPFDCLGCIYPLLNRFDAQKLDEEYTATQVVFDVSIPQKNLELFAKSLSDATCGQAIFSED
ncbi:MAG: YigZ family protein [Deltaproteobacteria bacterium]|nr:YigZ family protein [Deltaproteobacteria bacterium]